MTRQGLLTDHVFICGLYQSLPIALYGWPEAVHGSTEVRLIPFERLKICKCIMSALNMQIKPPPLLQLEMEDVSDYDNLIGGDSGRGSPGQLSPAARTAVDAVLPFWARVRSSEARMRAEPLPPELLAPLIAAADFVCGSLATGAESSSLIIDCLNDHGIISESTCPGCCRN